MTDAQEGRRSVRDIPDELTLRPRRLRRQRIAFAIAVVAPVLGTVAAVATSVVVGFSWIEPVTFVAMWIVSGVGIEVGYHRLLSHRAFKGRAWVERALAIAGNTALQGPAIYWVANHRFHHAHTDELRDPHTPHHHPRGRLAGLAHAHVGWIFAARRPSPARWARDLLADRALMRIGRLNLVWVLAGIAVPAAVGGLGTASWLGAWLGAGWGGFVRIFVAQHTTYLINSACHVWGRRPFPTRDRSTNLRWLVLPTFGGSLHNNHHAFPATATNDLGPGEIDPSAWLLRAAARWGWVWDLRRPSAAKIEERRHERT